MLTDISKELKDLILDTASKASGEPNLYKIEATLEHPDSEWSYELLQIEGLNIVQDFLDNYADATVLHTLVHPEKAIEIMEYEQGLVCSLVLTKHHWATFLPIEEGMIIRQYKAIITNLEDLSKTLNVREYNPGKVHEGSNLQAQDLSARVPMSFQLIEEELYAIRHQKINAIFDIGTTVPQVVNWILNSFNIYTVNIKDIDNTVAMSNMKIPPSHGIDSAFDYVQSNYGIYSKGFSFYYTDGVGYMWRPYAHEDTSEEVIKLYAAPNIPFDNADGYHYEEENDIHMITVDKVKLEAPILSGAENIGTTMTMHNSDMALAKHNNDPSDFRRVDNTGKVYANPGTTTYLSNSAEVLHQDRGNNAHHRTTGSNPFILASELASYQGIRYICNWKMSVPFSLYPAQSVMLHYDDAEGIFTTQKGILNAVAYQSIKTEDKVHADPFFVFGATMMFWLEPDPTTP